jgi:site-specific recombinase XerD
MSVLSARARTDVRPALVVATDRHVGPELLAHHVVPFPVNYDIGEGASVSEIRAGIPDKGWPKVVDGVRDHLAIVPSDRDDVRCYIAKDLKILLSDDHHVLGVTTRDPGEALPDLKTGPTKKIVRNGKRGGIGNVGPRDYDAVLKAVKEADGWTLEMGGKHYKITGPDGQTATIPVVPALGRPTGNGNAAPRTGAPDPAVAAVPAPLGAPSRYGSGDDQQLELRAAAWSLAVSNERDALDAGNGPVHVAAWAGTALGMAPPATSQQLPGNACARALPAPARSTSEADSASLAASVGWDLSRQVAEAYLIGVSAGSVRSYTGSLRAVFGFCAEAGVAPLELTRPGIEAYLHALRVRRGLAPASVGRHASVLAGYLAYAHQEAVIATNPMDRVRRPRVPISGPRFLLDVDQVRAMIAAAEAHDPRAHLLTVSLFVTGCRVGELLGADVADLGVERHCVTLGVRRKAGRRDVLVLPEPLPQLVGSFLAGRTDGPLLPSTSGRRWDRTGASRVLHRVARRALSPEVAGRFHVHACRAAAIGLGLEAGVDLRDVMVGAGHQRLSSTTRYLTGHRQLEDAAALRVAAYLARPSNGHPGSPPGVKGNE